MKLVLLWLIAIGPYFCLAQTKLKKSYPVDKGQTVSFHFDYPKNIRISTWEGKEVVVEATVKINKGESDSAFTLVESTANGTVSIANKLDMDAIPLSYYVMDKGSKIQFNSKQDMEAYRTENTGKGFSSYQTRDIEVSIEIKVPINVNTELTSVYGMVEVQDFNGPIKVDAKYGGVDASVTEQGIGKLQLTTQYGKIYTNLTLKPTEQIEKNFFTSITASPGKGSDYNFKSSFGNIYLRNAVK